MVKRPAAQTADGVGEGEAAIWIGRGSGVESVLSDCRQRSCHHYCKNQTALHRPSFFGIFTCGRGVGWDIDCTPCCISHLAIAAESNRTECGSASDYADERVARHSRQGAVDSGDGAHSCTTRSLD
jgi:hypothetical protein